jgi:hypothetical protein
VKKFLTIIILFLAVIVNAQVQPLKIAADKRFFQTQNGKPFFWMGDTGWLLFVKCTREEAIQYLDARQKQGFNVIQVMLLHDIGNAKNIYGSRAFENADVSKPNTTAGKNFAVAGEYDYWDHVDFIIDEAAKRGIYMALVPVWGNNVKSGKINLQQAAAYGKFLGERYKNKKNIIWINGGDIMPDAATLPIWNKLGATIKAYDKNHLMTFHPRGRNSSSDWFQKAGWLDFNMIQSGHKSYAQDTASNETRHFGEDNWRYIIADYKLKPARPTLDGEPSYEGIPYGLHDSTQPYWQAYEVRRYAYWCVFSGGAGITYGHNSIMQFYTKGDTNASFFPKEGWKEALTSPTTLQIKYLKQLMLEKMPFGCVPAPELVMNDGEKYDKVLALKGKDYAMFYVYNGRDITVAMDKLKFKPEKFLWYNTFYGAEGKPERIKKGQSTFDPPGEKINGNDWVLILETKQDAETEERRERERESGKEKD